MATITLEYDGYNPIAKKTIDFVLSLGIFTKKKTAVEVAMEDVKKGNVHTAKNAKDLIEHCLEDV